MHVNDQKNAVILETKRFNESKSDVSANQSAHPAAKTAISNNNP